jgi:glycine/D-amino acid oxidase-like deaminating enzyme
MLTAQGLIADLPDCDPVLDRDSQLKVGDQAYVYTEIWPGFHRLIGFFDFGIFDKAFVDPEREAYLKRTYLKNFTVEGDGAWKSMRAGLRPVAFDDMPFIGPLTHYPNVFVNFGHGGKGTSLCFATAEILAEIVNNDKKRWGSETYRLTASQRALI